MIQPSKPPPGRGGGGIHSPNFMMPTVYQDMRSRNEAEVIERTAQHFIQMRRQLNHQPPSQGQKCFMVTEKPKPRIKIDVVYIVVSQGHLVDTYGPRFVQSYLQFPPEMDHRLLIACNGGDPGPKRRDYFRDTQAEFILRPNDAGWDISAYQNIARQTDADFLLCLGESIHFHRAGWLRKIADARENYGPGMYGIFSSHFVRAHLNTTGFAADKNLLLAYPQVTNHPERYEFEHGHGCFWKQIASQGMATALVTWNNCWFPGEWRQEKGIMHDSDQLSLLAHCNHTSKFADGTPATRELWAAQSNTPFKL